LNLTEARLTPAAEVACLAGIQTSCAESSERTLLKMASLRLSESTVERITEATGQRVVQRLEAPQTFGDDHAWEWQRDARAWSLPKVRLSRDDRTAIELFIAAVRGWEGGIRRRLIDGTSTFS
jgi:hypothetical protein